MPFVIVIVLALVVGIVTGYCWRWLQGRYALSPLDRKVLSDDAAFEADLRANLPPNSI